MALLDHFAHGVTVVVLAVFFYERWSWVLCHMYACRRIIVKIAALGVITEVVTVAWYLAITYTRATIPLWLGFVVTALALWSLRYVSSRATQSYTWRKAIVLGCAQGAAFLPGISRFASTYTCARWLGLSDRKAFELSWLIVWPLIAIACMRSAAIIVVYELHTELLRPATIVVMLAAGIISFYALRYVQGVALRGRMWIFSLYMLVPIVLAIGISLVSC